LTIVPPVESLSSHSEESVIHQKSGEKPFPPFFSQAVGKTAVILERSEGYQGREGFPYLSLKSSLDALPSRGRVGSYYFSFPSPPKRDKNYINTHVETLIIYLDSKRSKK
jgi:hypothetical protein